ncbi:hypothetical protein [Microbacterium sp. B19]|uniref:hypothetical protein n=1 Tax=Microbacterium sp. B19 TaxID=96765 RepID=UPI000349AE8A|nr:hypothetical protein [Microbacterium sp. B19]
MQPVTSTSLEVVALVGEVAPYVKPEPIVAQPQGGGRSQGANAQRKRAARGQGSSDAAPRTSAPGEGRRRRGRGAGQAAPAADAAQPARQGQRSGSGRGQGGGNARGGANTARPQGAGRSASGAPTTGMVVGRGARTNRRAQG